jgi:hypothetical protein
MGEGSTRTTRLSVITEADRLNFTVSKYDCKLAALKYQVDQPFPPRMFESVSTSSGKLRGYHSIPP